MSELLNAEKGKIKFSKFVIVAMLTFLFIFSFIVLFLVYKKGTESSMLIEMYKGVLGVITAELGILGGMTITETIKGKEQDKD